MWGTQIGSKADMDEFEQDLIKKGFTRVPDTTTSEDMQVKQFRRRLKRPLIDLSPITDHVILWHE